MRKAPNWFAQLKTGSIRHQAGLLLLVLVLVFVAVVRLHLRQMPLERDEGEYAYAAQLLLDGKLPYESVYTMKLPGMYGAYALAMLVFGESPAAIRTLLWIVNSISIVLVFMLGRRLLDTTTGAVAAGCFGLMSLSPPVLGLAAHASQFVMMFTLLGFWVLLRGIDSGRASTLALSGVMFGLAFIMKQPGLLFGLFGLAYLCLRTVIGGTGGLRNLLKQMCLFTLGLAAPFGATCMLFWAAGAFDKFWFWTFSYAHQYVSVLSFAEGTRVLRVMLSQVATGNLFFAILAMLGFGVLWWDERLYRYRLFLVGFVLCSIAALWPGMYFRHHYFVFVLPAVALLAGVAVSRSWFLPGRDTSIELLLTPVTSLLLIVAVFYALVIHGSVWFAKTPAVASKLMYGNSIFVDSVSVAEHLQNETTATDKIAVLGSEPQIYFYSRRRAATGYIYMYPLMEPHPYAARMQDELIRELESALPQYVVFVNMHTSWLRRPESERKMFDWWNAYSKTNYLLARVFTPVRESRAWDPEKFLPYLLGDYSVPQQFIMQSVQPDETVPLAIHVYKKRNAGG